ncbi:hypothetical protein IGI04_015002 [Brassica rapa subsp. trilocularis]|uniref:RNase H type-1 domain-containing protein n=1 Tax=Brassica rapa subsp. trilocularis TaxID=1813537 RepID=A0ABQ7MNV5_BRACM|nr:hypothetical protein IGI04_015002 [Brassica rapa subsp. trilocularis]
MPSEWRNVRKCIIPRLSLVTIHTLRVFTASVQATARIALFGDREWLQAQDPNLKSPKNTQIAGRPPSPSLGTVTCNTDAAWKKETLDAGLAWIFDTSSSPSDGCKFQTRVSSALMAEVLAFRKALSHTHHIGITNIWLRSDSLSLVKTINSISKPMNLYRALSDIKVLSSCMLSSTRSNKEYLLLFSDPARLERIIHKEKCAASIDNKSDPSTDTRELPPIDTSIRTLIDIHPRDMVATCSDERREWRPT